MAAHAAEGGKSESSDFNKFLSIIGIAAAVSLAILLVPHLLLLAPVAAAHSIGAALMVTPKLAAELFFVALPIVAIARG
jgi:hypothetical protein